MSSRVLEPSPPRSSRPVVLVVDDHPDMRSLLIECLDLWGYDAVPASNGREAWQLLESGRSVSLILLDLMMPVMDGWTFRAQQLRHPGFDKIPTAVLTAAPRELQRGSDLRVSHCLTKPLDVEVLEQIVRSLAPPPSTMQ